MSIEGKFENKIIKQNEAQIPKKLENTLEGQILKRLLSNPAGITVADLMMRADGEGKTSLSTVEIQYAISYLADNGYIKVGGKNNLPANNIFSLPGDTLIETGYVGE